MLQGFKDFILRGNVVELAVAVAIGAAFTTVVNAVVAGILDPLIALVAGKADLTDVWAVEVADATFTFGAVLGALLNFLLVAAAIYFVVVFPMNRLAARRKAGAEPAPVAPPADGLLLQEIRDLLRDGRAVR